MQGRDFEARLAAVVDEHGAVLVEGYGEEPLIGFTRVDEEDLEEGEGDAIRVDTGEGSFITAAELLARYRSTKDGDWDEFWVQDSDEADVQSIDYVSADDSNDARVLISF